MTSWLGVVRGRTRAASSRSRALSWPAGTLTVLVTGLAVGLPGAGVSYGLDEPHGAVPTGSSSGSATLSWSSLLSGSSGAPSWPAGSPTAASGASPGAAGGSGAEPSAVPPPQDEKPSATAPSPSGTSEEAAEETPEETEASEESEGWSEGRSEKPGKRPRGSATPTAHGPAASSPDPSDKPSRAGSRAGEGRQRPGREKGPLEEQEVARDKRDGDKRADARDASRTPDAEREGEGDGDTEPESSDTADAPAQDTAPSATPTRHARPPAPHADGPAEPVLEVLPLGAGLVLVGLGLGLAFVGLRLRRG
ncbi:hypothetical protein ACWGKK_13925 [Streptomyces chartreusis]|uniref:hypothetical protein n=1 Tax=unclassified Streptomyces TaxID=2593676 RepID=UPI00089BAEDF|nr:MULTISPECIES: hypothetical protein [unclassified Streptomyces]SEC84209.1 hypothetical protein SAMN05216482_4850 [Streptomyces sp. PAN_FS17]SEC90106.1 hypothetical protein SAMN05428938_3278 [Streptomyces sp. KS_5]